MLLNSKGLALILAISIAAILLGSLFLFPELPTVVFWVVPFITFGSGYLLIYIILEFLFFRELKDIYAMFGRIRDNDLAHVQPNRRYGHDALNQIHQEIYSYAQVKQSEIDELKRMAKFRRQFLADVSHELKTPIFAAQGFVYTLLDGAIYDETIRMKFLKKAAKNLDGLDALVQDLLTVSHMEAGDITMQIELVNMSEMVFEIFDQLEERARKKDLHFVSNKLRSEEVIAKADTQRIYQVMINLISNAVKYSDTGGQIAVNFETADDRLAVTVKDSGIGIPQKHLNRIFERFYRVDKSRSKKQGGTGLGLSIVKHIVEAHGSEVSVTSQEGKGSIFKFDLAL